MKVLKIIIPLICCFTAIYCSSSCERDDICSEDTQTTPFLIVKFLDYNTKIDLKKPNELQVKATNRDSIIDYSATNQDSIRIPLRTDVEFTEYEFTIDTDTADDDSAPNTDRLSFQYTTEEEYVSSACGFRISYNGLTNTLYPEEGDDTNWIKDITIEEDNVTNETTAHVFIYH